MAMDSVAAISGRTREQELLRRLLESPRAEFLAIFGRRRVGKTFLVRQYFTGKAQLFEVTGRHDATLKDNLRVFADALSDSFHHGEDLAPPTTWHEAFRRLRRELERRRTRHKRVIFLDELPWLATHKSGFLQELELFWNSWCSRRTDIIVIVCGSAASWMLRNIVNAKGGLHNRLTATLRLLPFTLAEACSFVEGRGVRLTRRQMLELYMAVGGVPHYLEKIRRGDSMAQAIDSLCFHRDGPLVGEFDRLFKSLYENAELYLKIVTLLARRRLGVERKSILDAAGLHSGGSANRVLANLEEAGFMQTTIPFGRGTRDRFYRLVDEFSLFHLHWMTRRRPRTGAYWSLVRGSAPWNAWSGLAFESLCLKHVDAIERALGISGVLTEASSWLSRAPGKQGNGAQIDLLIDRADDVISICELKHTAEPFAITRRYADDLRRKLAVFRSQTRTRKALQLVLVTTAGLVDNVHARELVDRQIDLDAFWEGRSP